MWARFLGDHGRAANLDTFVYTNAAPQVNTFNQSKELWVGLEDYVLEFADSTDQRIVVLTGPVFADDDVGIKASVFCRNFSRWPDDLVF